MTATPERADGRSIYSYFEGRIAAEIRLWEAIERKLLSPFHDFGVTVNVDLSQVRWVAVKYDEREIENLFVFERAVAVKRVGNVIRAIENYCLERADIIGIGFCLTKKHAEYMSNISGRCSLPGREEFGCVFRDLEQVGKDYSPSTMYQDYSINEELFHWQSQSRTTEESITGQRYINQAVHGGNVLFFVREYKEDGKFTSPYTCIGFADVQSHYGSAPISMVWRMKEPLPGFVMKKTVKV